MRRGIELLMNQPEIAPRIDAQLRRLVLTRFPYSLIFAVTSDAIQIIAILHIVGPATGSSGQARTDLL